MVLLFLLPAAALQASPPLRQEFKPSGPTCYLNKDAARANAARLEGIHLQGAPVTSTPTVLVIRVDFSDQPMTASKEEADAFFARVQGFYLENSYGVFRPTFTVTEDVHRLGALATFGSDCGGDIACHDGDLRLAAVAAEDAAGRDFSGFTQVMILHAGNGQETTGLGQDIWSVFFPDDFVVDAKAFKGFTVVPEKEAGNIDSLSVICHEYGHQLGLPDLYDVSASGGASTVGAWDLMDYPYTAALGGVLGANPPHLGAWSKSFLAFVQPSTWTGVGAASLGSSNLAPDVIKIPLTNAGAASTEYLLVEYRNTTSTATYDRGIPGSGVLVWHIDDGIALAPARLANNDVNTPSLSGRGHRGVDLVEADFTESYGAGQHIGQPGDAFRDAGALLPPASDAFSGAGSGAALTSVSGVSGQTASFFIELPSASTSAFSGAAGALSVPSSGGDLSVDLSAGAFPDGTRLLTAPYSAATLLSLGSASAASALTATGVGFVLSAQSGRAPAGGANAHLSYAGRAPLSSLSAEDASRLVFARYVPQRRQWVPVATQVDTAAQTLTARLDQFSVLQVMQASPGSSPGDVRVFPNPLRPSLGESYATMTLANMPADARVRVFTAAGALIREVRADDAGQATWDGRNGDGERAASGVYLVVVEDPGGGRRKIVKVAIER